MEYLSLASSADENIYGLSDISVEEQKAVDETHGGIVHKIKLAFICVKITVVSMFLLCAINRYVRKFSGCSVVVFMLSCYVIMLITLLIMDFTLKLIPLFFLLVLLANYFNFVGFFYVMKNLPSNRGRNLRKRTKTYFIVMNCIYAGVLALAFVPGYRPMCTDEKTYPAVMNFASCLFLINYMFHWVIKCNKDWFMADEGLLPGPETAPLNESGEFQERKLSWEHKVDSVTLRKQMFNRQMGFFMCFSTILVVINVFIQVWGRLVSEEAILGCAEKGYQWLYTTTIGSLFVTAHIVQIIMQAVMLEKALYKVPHEMEWFEAPIEHIVDDTEDSPRDDDDQKPAIKNVDDDFARTA